MKFHLQNLSNTFSAKTQAWICAEGHKIQVRHIVQRHCGLPLTREIQELSGHSTVHVLWLVPLEEKVGPHDSLWSFTPWPILCFCNKVWIEMVTKIFQDPMRKRKNSEDKLCSGNEQHIWRRKLYGVWFV